MGKMMKHRGNTFYYEDLRNRDLMRAYHSLLKSDKNIRLSDVYNKVVNMQSERFWVSEERAAIVVSAMLAGRPLIEVNVSAPARVEMFQEIYRRFCEIKKAQPERSIYDIVTEVVISPAPKFYLTPSSAKVIINKIEKGWYEQRKRKYRHLFM